ncbi:MAG: serine hydrolase domain-containing protein [Anaerolineales bacterium]
MKKFLIFMLVLCLLPVSAVFGQDEALQEFAEDNASPDGTALGIWVSSPAGVAVAVTGSADLENNTPATINDAFRIGSITKTFAAVLMLMLVEEGTLSLDDALGDWLADDIVGRIPNGDTVTLRQLLDMTSGIPDYLNTDAFLDAMFEDPTYGWTAAETVTYIYDVQPLFGPGESFEYSNTNYNLIELVINEATGLSLAEAMQTYIFAEIGMQNSFVEDPAALGTGIIQGYERDDDGRLENATFFNDGVGMADGGIISTVQDLEMFIRALFDGQLISAESLVAMRSGTPMEEDESETYGLGLNVIDAGDTFVLGHEGSTAGFTAALWYFEEFDTVVVAFTNEGGSDVIRAELVGGAFEIVFE